MVKNENILIFQLTLLEWRELTGRARLFVYAPYQHVVYYSEPRAPSGDSLLKLFENDFDPV